MNRLYIFGGSFNPFHRGHEAIVEAVIKETGKIYLLPTQNPGKKATFLSLEERIEVLKKLYQNNKQVEVLDLCLRDTEYNYMYKVVEHFSPQKIVFVMGEDTFQQLPHWKNYAQFKDQIETLVFSRENKMSQHRPLFIDINISSTRCRELGPDSRHLLPRPVYDYLAKKGFKK